MKNYLIISLITLILGCSKTQKEYNIDELLIGGDRITEKFSNDPVNGSVYQMVGGKWESKKVILGKIKDGIKVGKWTYYNKDGSKKEDKEY